MFSRVLIKWTVDLWPGKCVLLPENFNCKWWAIDMNITNNLDLSWLSSFACCQVFILVYNVNLWRGKSVLLAESFHCKCWAVDMKITKNLDLSWLNFLHVFILIYNASNITVMSKLSILLISITLKNWSGLLLEKFNICAKNNSVWT